jgi:aryl-alcohol dehydrogenase-like predicted oxidoreductase
MVIWQPSSRSLARWYAPGGRGASWCVPVAGVRHHPGAPARLAALRDVARETGAAVSQVVLAWRLGGELPAIPLAPASSVAHLEESGAGGGGTGWGAAGPGWTWSTDISVPPQALRLRG